MPPATQISVSASPTEKRIIDEKTQQKISEKNPNRYYFRELKEKGEKIGIPYSQMLSSIRSEEQLLSLKKDPRHEEVRTEATHSYPQSRVLT